MAWQGLKLNLRVSQKQILTPGLVQMVSVLALNRLELREMINQKKFPKSPKPIPLTNSTSAHSSINIWIPAETAAAPRNAKFPSGLRSKSSSPPPLA